MIVKLLIIYLVLGVFFVLYDLYLKPSYKMRGRYVYEFHNERKLRVLILPLLIWPIIFLLNIIKR
jgi:hypothetical protein